MDSASEVVRVFLIAIAAWVGAVWAAGTVYIAVSYANARSHVPPRPLHRAVRSILREAWCVVWTQPLLIAYQFAGRRMGSGGGDVPVVLIHGYFQNRVDFLYLARRLRRAGSGPLFACNFFWPQSLERSSAAVARFIDQVRAETGAPRVDLLTHSTGGLFALDYIAQNPGAVRRAVVVALPARGVPWRGPVLGPAGSQLRTGSLYHATHEIDVGSVPVMSVYSAQDNLVHPVQTSQIEGESATNFEVADPGHLAVLFDREAADAIVGFLGAQR